MRRHHLSKEETEAMSIIRRAAALMKDKVDQTPGCRYVIRISDDCIACAVRLPDGLKPGTTLETYPFLAQGWDDIIYDMMANAVAEITKDIRIRMDAVLDITEEVREAKAKADNTIGNSWQDAIDWQDIRERGYGHVKFDEGTFPVGKHGLIGGYVEGKSE